MGMQELTQTKGCNNQNKENTTKLPTEGATDYFIGNNKIIMVNLDPLKDIVIRKQQVHCHISIFIIILQ